MGAARRRVDGVADAARGAHEGARRPPSREAALALPRAVYQADRRRGLLHVVPTGWALPSLAGGGGAARRGRARGLARAHDDQDSRAREFGEHDFRIDVAGDDATIRVGVVEADSAPLVLERIVSMVEQLRDEALGCGIVFRVLLRVDRKGEKHGVDVAVAKANRALPQPSARVRAVNGVLVDASALEPFFAPAAKMRSDGMLLVPVASLRRVVVPRLGEEFGHHVFLSHYQRFAGDACAVLAMLLRERGVACWMDQEAAEGDINKGTMLRGVERSMTYLLFLTKDVFSRPYVLMEARRAVVELKRPVILVHESDTSRVGYESLPVLRAQAPSDLEAVFDAVESEPFQRRAHLREPMVNAIVERIVRVAAAAGAGAAAAASSSREG